MKEKKGKTSFSPNLTFVLKFVITFEIKINLRRRLSLGGSDKMPKNSWIKDKGDMKENVVRRM